MSEPFVKFYLDTEIVPYSIVDAENGEAYPIEDEGIFETVVNLLNEHHVKNENLKMILSNFYNVELCELCEHAEYTRHFCYSDGVYEYDMCCLKGHKSKGGIYEFEEVGECADFKIRDDMSEKPFLKIVNDFYIQYGDESQLFDLHKPSDIRNLIYVLNRDNGFNELKCEYNGDIDE